MEPFILIRRGVLAVLLLASCGPAANPALESHARENIAIAVQLEAKYGRGILPVQVTDSPNGFGPWRIGCARNEGGRRVMVIDGKAVPEPTIGDGRWFGHVWTRAGCAD